ncbi:MAG: patatin-like phospholipase family protein [Ferruginibacter sp.]
MSRSPLNYLGLSLSGGGYRAAAFHLGTMTKLHELRLLEKINILSTISGGSIIGASYCLTDSAYEEFEAKMTELLSTKNVIRYILTSFAFIRFVIFILVFIYAAVHSLFTPYPYLSFIILALMIVLIIVFQYALFPVSKVIEEAYNKFFFSNATLSDLLDKKPSIAIGSTNIQTSRPFTFSKAEMNDSTYKKLKPPVLFNNDNFPVATAVMASSCVPFAFTPITINAKYFVNSNDMSRANPVLVDGGVYDNQGIHKLTQRDSGFECEVVITSDAGAGSPFKRSYNNVIVLLIRCMDVFMSRIKKFQMQEDLYRNTDFANRQIAYISLGWDIENCIPGFIDNLKKGQVTASVILDHKIPPDWLANIDAHRSAIQNLLEANTNYEKIYAEKLTATEIELARKVSTNLTCLSREQVKCLAGHAANITELQVKLYCPTLFKSSSI